MEMFVDRVAANNNAMMNRERRTKRNLISRRILLDTSFQSAVDRSVEEQKSLHDGHAVVEVRGMGLELLFVVRGEKAPGPSAVVVQRDAFAGVLAQVVGTAVTVFFETVLLLENARKTRVQ